MRFYRLCFYFSIFKTLTYIRFNSFIQDKVLNGNCRQVLQNVTSSIETNITKKLNGYCSITFKKLVRIEIVHYLFVLQIEILGRYPHT